MRFVFRPVVIRTVQCSNVGTQWNDIYVYMKWWTHWGKSPDGNIIVPGEEEKQNSSSSKTTSKEETEQKQKKRTGKSRPAEERLKFEDYFVRWLAEKEVIYKYWNSYHREGRLCVCLGDPGQFPLIPTLMLGKWKIKCFYLEDARYYVR